MDRQSLPGSEAPPNTALWSRQRRLDFQAAEQQSVTGPIAILRVAALDLTVPVYPTASELHLNRGAALIEGMSAPDRGGNLGIAGHRDGFFRVLKDIEPGVVIEVETHVRLYRYQVAAIDVVDASDRRLLADTDDPTITLVTCYPFYYVGDAPQRFIVRGVYLWPSSPVLSQTHT